jgi:hypothetical protein
MGGKMIDNAKPPLDGLRFHDQSRFQSSEVTRAFISATRAAAQGPQSEMSGPDEISLDPDAAISDVAIVRGVD